MHTTVAFVLPDGVLILLRMHGLVSPEFPLSTATKLRNPTHADDHLHTHEQHTRTPPEDHSKTQSVTKEQSAERRGGGREYACCKLHNKPAPHCPPTTLAKQPPQPRSQPSFSCCFFTPTAAQKPAILSFFAATLRAASSLRAAFAAAATALPPSSSQ